ncbi:MAG TPA: cyclic-di-AMP receptor [Bacillota bacterium]|nr:cyclic-di-AMP receptor [Bacillota bacterium]
MKLILAVIPNDDSMIATSALTNAGFFVTKLSTTGGFLMVGNTTLLIGTEDERITELKGLLKKHCSSRTQLNPSQNSFGRGMKNHGMGEETTVSGATIFILGVEDYEKL